MCSILPLHRENINRIKKEVSCRVWSEAAHAEWLMSSLLSDGDVCRFNSMPVLRIVIYQSRSPYLRREHAG